LSLVTGVLPKHWNAETEALDGREGSSVSATFANLDVAATPAFARKLRPGRLESRAPGFGQHDLTSSPTGRTELSRPFRAEGICLGFLPGPALRSSPGYHMAGFQP
jgi:hypothetical protein